MEIQLLMTNEIRETISSSLFPEIINLDNKTEIGERIYRLISLETDLRVLFFNNRSRDRLKKILIEEILDTYHIYIIHGDLS